MIIRMLLFDVAVILFHPPPPSPSFFFTHCRRVLSAKSEPASTSTSWFRSRADPHDSSTRYALPMGIGELFRLVSPAHANGGNVNSRAVVRRALRCGRRQTRDAKHTHTRIRNTEQKHVSLICSRLPLPLFVQEQRWVCFVVPSEREATGGSGGGGGIGGGRRRHCRLPVPPFGCRVARRGRRRLTLRHRTLPRRRRVRS